MSKYQLLWEYVSSVGVFPLTLNFDEIAAILGYPIDHSFLSYKKEANSYGFAVGKISLKNRTVLFVAA